MTVIGSLTTAKIRFENQEESSELDGHFEIVSMEGTDGCKSPGGGHYHIVISDEKGQTFGGHLVVGSIVYTTAEVIIADVREYDKEAIYDELVVHPAQGNC